MSENQQVPFVQAEVTTETVFTAKCDYFPDHPESYSPRVFFSTVQEQDGHVTHVRHYELLKTGYVLMWKTLPEGKFDFMYFTIQNLHCMSMRHADRPTNAYWAGTTVPAAEQVGPSIPTLELR